MTSLIYMKLFLILTSLIVTYIVSLITKTE